MKYFFDVNVQAGLVVCCCFLHDFSLKGFENVHHFSNLCSNFQFNAIWFRRSKATLL